MLPLLVYIIESVCLFCLFVCLFAVNVKNTDRIGAKRSGITIEQPEECPPRVEIACLSVLGEIS